MNSIYDNLTEQDKQLIEEIRKNNAFREPYGVPTYIYTLSDETGIRYVGQTCNPKVRLGRHSCDARAGRDRTKRGQWIKALEDSGLFATMTIVEKCFSSDSNEKEKHWATYYLEQGCNLVNNLEKLGLKNWKPQIKIE